MPYSVICDTLSGNSTASATVFRKDRERVVDGCEEIYMARRIVKTSATLARPQRKYPGNMRFTSEWRQKYMDVLASDRWRELRTRLIAECGGKCETCGAADRKLELHHKTYERLGEEMDSDLQVLCKGCHAAADSVRASEGQQRSIAAYYSAGVDSYATKKYGEDWGGRMDVGEMSEEFDRWRERRGYD
jgi:hypothetical protein